QRGSPVRIVECDGQFQLLVILLNPGKLALLPQCSIPRPEWPGCSSHLEDLKRACPFVVILASRRPNIEQEPGDWSRKKRRIKNVQQPPESGDELPGIFHPQVPFEGRFGEVAQMTQNGHNPTKYQSLRVA